MRTRRTALALLALLASLLVLPVAAAATEVAEPPVPVDSLAVGAEEGEEPPGPEPRPADAEDNRFAPEDYARPWTWWLGVAIFVPTVLVVGLGALAYYYLVYRPRQGAERPPVRR